METQNHDKAAPITAEEAGRIAATRLQGQLLNAFAAEGPSPRLVVAKLKQLMRAQTVKPHFDKSTGKFVYSKPMEDWGTQVKTLQLYLEMFGAFLPKGIEFSGEITNKPPTEEMLKAIRDELI